jgi:hypothetical protein
MRRLRGGRRRFSLWRFGHRFGHMLDRVFGCARLERLRRFRLVLESVLSLGFRVGFHGRAIGRRRHAGLAVAPVAPATAAAAPSAAPVAIAARLGAWRALIPAVAVTDFDMSGFH